MDDILINQKRFNDAVRVILDHEGGYSNNPDDPGGETKFGITSEDLNGTNLKVIDLTEDDAKHFYKIKFWDKYHYNEIHSLHLATKIFDMSVNMGSFKATLIVQRAIRTMGDRIPLDGILGSLTLQAINELCLNGEEERLIRLIRNNQKYYYYNIVAKNPKLQPFLEGWLNRVKY